MSLIGAMIVGRAAWGIVSIPLNGIAGSSFSWQMFMAGAFLNAIPGIILQIAAIPVIIIALKKRVCWTIMSLYRSRQSVMR